MLEALSSPIAVHSPASACRRGDHAGALARPTSTVPSLSETEGRSALKECLNAIWQPSPKFDSETKIAGWNLNKMVAVSTWTPGCSIRRRASSVWYDQLDQLVLLAAFGGDGLKISVDDDFRQLPPREPVLVDLSKACELSVGRGVVLQLFVSRDALEALLYRRCPLHGASLGGAAKAMVMDHLVNLAEKLSSLRASEAEAVAAATLHLVAAALTVADVASPEFREPSRSTPLRTARRYVEQHLPDPQFSVAELCKALRISRATLYRLFEPLGGVAS